MKTWIVRFMICSMFMLARLSSYSQSEASTQHDTSALWHHAIELERAAFHAPSLRIHDSILFEKVQLYKQHGRVDLALQTINRFTLCVDSTWAYRRWTFERALLFYLNHQYENAEWAYTHLENNCADSSFLHRSHYLKLLIWAQTKESKWVKPLFTAYCEAHGTPMAESEAIWKKIAPSQISPQKALLLSAIVPGLGQCYALESVGGVEALLFKGLTVAWISSQIAAGYVATPIISGSQLVMQFWRGDSRKALLNARKYNLRKKTIFIAQLTEFISKTEHNNP